MAAPLYFSFLRILITVLGFQISLPAGVGILFSVNCLAIADGFLPSRKSLYINLTTLASFSTIFGNPSSPFSYPRKCL